MVKEFILICLVMAVFWMLMQLIRKKWSSMYVNIAALVIILAIIVNVFFNMSRLLPDTWLETASGEYKYGTMTNNMLAYEEDFRHRDEIMFPLLRNRDVYLPEDATYCRKYFETYSKSVSFTSPISDEEKRILERDASKDESYDYICEFDSLERLTYVWGDGMTESMKNNYDRNIFPKLFIDTKSLENNTKISVQMDAKGNLYIKGI